MTYWRAPTDELKSGSDPMKAVFKVGVLSALLVFVRAVGLVHWPWWVVLTSIAWIPIAYVVASYALGLLAALFLWVLEVL